MRDGGVVGWSRVGFVAAAWLFVVGVVVQVFLAGLSIFDDASRWQDHTSIGQWIGVLTILMLIFAVAGRLPRLVIALSVLVLLLYGLQIPFANTDSGVVAALHPVNALALFWLTVWLAGRVQPLAFGGRGDGAHHRGHFPS